MKRLSILIIALSIMISGAYAKDIIVMRNGDLIDVTVIEITPTEVKYKKASRPEGPLYSVNKSEILAINYEDGEKEMFEVEPTSVAVVANDNFVPSISKDSLNIINNAYVNKVNSIDIEFINEKVKSKGKTAKKALVQYWFDENSVFNDGIIEVSFDYKAAEFKSSGILKDFSSSPYVHNAFQPIIKNLTNQIVYIDLSNTFFSENSESVPYYIPMATTTGSTSTTGGTLNLGAVTNALGVEGGIGSLANGLNIGKSNSNTTQTVTYSQRVVSIAPFASIKLDWKPYIPNLERSYSTTQFARNFWRNYSISMLELRIPESEKFSEGTTYSYSKENSPHQCSFYLTYSSNENLSDTNNIQQIWYAKKIIGAGNPWWKYSNHLNNFGDIPDDAIWTYINVYQ